MKRYIGVFLIFIFCFGAAAEETVKAPSIELIGDSIYLDGVPEPLIVPGSDVLSLPVRARIQRAESYGIMNIEFSVTASDDPGITVSEDSRFLGPTP